MTPSASSHGVPVQRHSAPPPPDMEIRYRARLPVSLRCNAGSLGGVTRDVGRDGLAIVTDFTPPLRRLFSLRTVLPTTGREFVCHAMVEQSSDDDLDHEGPRVLGLRLFLVDREARAAWSDFIEYAERDTGPRFSRKRVGRA